VKPETFLAWFPVALRYGALIGVAYETVFEQFDRPYLLGLFGTMLAGGEIARGYAIAKRVNDDDR
jgi:hypothetical protein